MSEYQYYEFQAVDTPLGEREQRELRAISSRATITSTRFANSYSWGDLKADPANLVERYFDAHLYLANWGTRALTFRFPRRLLDLEIAKRHCRGGAASARGKGDHVIVDFCSEEEASDWVAEDEGPGHLAALLPVRSEVAGADLRALYLGWLLCAQNGDLADADEEPPCPPGLRALSAPLEAMIDFLRIDRDLVDAAAAGNADTGVAPRREIERWAAALPEEDRTALLVRLVEGGDPHLRSEMVRRFRASRGSGSGAGPPRTAGQLLAEAERRRTERERAETEQAARERARRERAAAEARARELDALARREAEAWAEIDAHVATKQPLRYDEAVKLLRDLRDLCVRRGDTAAVEARIERLCAEHEKKPSFVRRVRSALLSGHSNDAPPRTKAVGVRRLASLHKRQRNV
jgi:hypothetical protein